MKGFADHYSQLLVRGQGADISFDLQSIDVPPGWQSGKRLTLMYM